jgi:antirestriction protein ArdC
MALNVYEIITDRILHKMAQGIVPWRQPWVGGVPKNLVSGKEYRGVNVFLLASSRFTSPYFLTYKQATGKGGQVRKGEHGTPVVFWKVGDSNKVDPATGKKGKYFILRYYTVFNVTQCEGIEAPVGESAVKFNPIAECEQLVETYTSRPHIQHGGGRACYIPSLDHIHMPNRESFHTPEEYYSTLFHELTHSTGSESRLNRKGITDPIKFASHDYSFEELVAECGAAFLCGHTGIENKTLDNSVAYLQSWTAKLRSEPRWIVEAASQAAKAADLIRGVKASHKDEDEEAA